MLEPDNDAVDHGCHAEVCEEMVGELIDIATWLSRQGLSPMEFATTVATFEARKHQRFGLKLSCAISQDRLVHFTLRFLGSEELCASMDVDPATGEMTIQRACV